MTLALVHVLPDGLLFDGRGVGRVMVAIASVAFIALALPALGPVMRSGRRVALVAAAILGGTVGAWLLDAIMTGLLVPIGLSLFGAALGGPLAAALAARALKLDVRATLDALALSGLTSAILARAGCLFAGCDIGRAAPDALFTVRYAAGTPAFDHLASRGLLSPGAAMTGPLHAFPLYEMLLVTGALVALVVLRHNLAPGVRAALAGATYFAARTVAELFRDHTDGGVAPLLLSVSALAATLLALVFLLQQPRASALGD